MPQDSAKPRRGAAATLTRVSLPPALQGLGIPSPIAVTGASGYIASWITKYLLDAGSTVHATVRDPSREDKVGHLRRLDAEAPGNLRLFSADLLEEGSFDEAFAGCKAVIHTASPFLFVKLDDPVAQLIRPALEGTRNVLGAVDATPSVDRVVLTSSAAAVYGDCVEIRSKPGGAFDEDDWNTTSSPEHNPYNYSKTVAEREAWTLAKAQRRWSLVAVNPTVAVGPPLSDRTDSFSSDTVKRFVDGRLRMGAPGLHFGVVDVRDIAMAHLLAAAKPEAAGRHLLCAEVVSMMDMARSLRRSFGDRYPLPRMQAPKALVYVVGPFEGLSWRFVRDNVGIPIRIDTTRSRDLGVEYRSIDDSLREHVDAMQRFGWLER